MESYTKKSLLLDVLNEVCGQLNIKVSSLIFLNYEFTNEQIRDLYQYLTLKYSLALTVEAFELSQELISIKPNLGEDQAEDMASQLIDALRKEGRFENAWV